MKVQVIGRTDTGVPCRWAVLDNQDRLLPQTSHYMAHLEAIESSPNTLRATAYDLRLFFEFVELSNCSWESFDNALLGRFARWFRFEDANVTAISESVAVRSRSSANRALATVVAFYRFMASLGDEAPGAAVYRQLERSATSYRKPMTSIIDNVGNASRYRKRRRLGPRLPRTKTRQLILTVQQVHAILEACRDSRDRLLIMLAFSAGLRVGQILGLRHEDIDTFSKTITVTARDDNPNGARSKRGRSASVPISDQVARLYIDYMHGEYGFIDSPYVFIDYETLAPSTYSAARSIVARLRRHSGVTAWSLHTLRHTFVTLSRRAGVPIDVISELVMHASVVTTVQMYSHLDAEDLRDVLLKHGVWEVQNEAVAQWNSGR